MGFWHFLVGSMMEPTDDFRNRLRKSVVGVLMFPCFFLALAYALRGFIVYSVPSQLAGAAACLGLSVVNGVSYGWMRAHRTVTGNHIALTLWALALFLTIAFLAFPEFDCKSFVFSCASLGVMTQMPTLLWYGMFLLLQMLVVDWNTAVVRFPEYMLTMPDPYIDNTIGVRMAGLLCGSIVLLTCIYMFYAQVKESERRGVAQTATIEMTKWVLKHQRSYDTKEVGKILAQCSEQNIVDSELITLFREMNDNLECYRAFLPNYLFLGKAGQQGEDDAMSILSDAPVGAFLLEHSDDDSLLGSSDGDEQSIHSSDSSNGRRSSQDSVENRLNRSAEKVNILMKQPQQQPQQQVQEAPGPAASSYCGNIVQAWVEIQNNEWFSTKLVNKPFSSRSLRYQRNTMSVFTESLFDLAQTTKASVHSLVGDTVQLSWNATHRVAQPELKASTFLLRLKQALSIALPDVKLAGAACAGQAEVHNITSFGTHQRAMYVDAPWTPALEACFTLAKRHKTLVVDANVECGSHYIVAAQGVDCIRYVPKVAIVPGTGEPGVGTLQSGAHGMPNLMPKGFPPATPDAFDTLLGVQGPQQEESAQTFLERKPVQHTIAYELVRRKQQEISGDQEWMYQLPEGEGGSDDASRREIEPLVTKALLLVADGRAGEAALLLVEKKVINLNRKTDEGTQRSEQGQRSAAYAAEVMYSDDDGEDPDYTPVTTIRLDPIAKAVALANPGKEAEEKAKPLPVNNALLERLAKFCHGKT